MKAHVVVLLTAVLFPNTLLLADLPFEVHALTGEHAPGFGPNENFVIFTYASNAAGGRIAFGSFVGGGTVTSDNDVCLFAGAADSPVLVAREGDASPTGGGETLDFLSAPAINASGTVVVRSTLSPSGTGIFRRTEGGALETLARNGSQVDGSPNVLMGSGTIGNRYPIDAAGNAYFITILTGASVSGDTNFALLRAGDAGLATVARTGITVPAGVPVQTPAILFNSFSVADANGNGQVAFLAGLTNSGAGEDVGIWFWDSGSLSLVAREGSAAPGLAGATFLGFGSGLSVGDDGSVGFGAKLAGPGVTADNEETVWAGGPGALRLVAREGNAAPGLGPGVVFDQLVLTGNLEIAPAVNPAGRCAFLARLRGTGVTDANNDSLWVEDGNGDLRLVIREGTLIPSGNATDLALGTSNALFLPITLDPTDGFSTTDRLVFSAESNNGSFDGIYEAEVPGDLVGPTVKINGPKSRRTKRPRLRISGTAVDGNAVARVEVKVGKGAFRRAFGTTRWFRNVRLKRGGNRILARAADVAGNLSQNAVVRVRRRK